MFRELLPVYFAPGPDPRLRVCASIVTESYCVVVRCVIAPVYMPVLDRGFQVTCEGYINVRLDCGCAAFDFKGWCRALVFNLESMLEYEILEFFAPLVAVRAVQGAVCVAINAYYKCCLLYTSPSPRDRQKSRMPSSA